MAILLAQHVDVHVAIAVDIAHGQRDAAAMRRSKTIPKRPSRFSDTRMRDADSWMRSARPSPSSCASSASVRRSTGCRAGS